MNPERTHQSILLLSIVALLFFTSCFEKDSSNNGLLSFLPANNSGTNDSGGSQDTPGTGLIRSTQYGKIEGKTDVESTWAWLGVPYAKPPVGSLRWRAPQSPDPWTGVKKTDAFCSICAQYGNFISETGRDSLKGIIGNGVLVGSEDCLYLNVWRPQTREKLPVFVFIHGGANIIGRSDLTIYNGARLASRQKMVVVTMNYRLGPLGWFFHNALKTGDPKDDSGNYGTLDLIKTLEWIRDNIAAFGGDPDNVTISGQSAGGMNVATLLVSPLAKGLFHRAILISGPPVSYPMSSAEARATLILDRFLIMDDLADSYIEAASVIAQKSDAWIAGYLRSKPLSYFFPPMFGGPLGFSFDTGPFALFQTGMFEDGYVIPKNVPQMLADGNYQKVPIILGCTKEELKLFIPFFIVDPGVLYDVMADFDPDHPNAKLSDLLNPVLWPLLYLYDPLARIGQLAFQTYGVDTIAKYLKKYQDNVWAYKFCWDEEPSPFDFFIGAGHAMDLPFLFGSFLTEKSSLTSFAWSTANRAGREGLSTAIMDYYAQFARTGNPNRPGSGLLEWTPWSSTKGDPKRIIFDTGGLAMSSQTYESSENISLPDLIEEVTALINSN